MTPDRPWPAGLTRVTGRLIKGYRKARQLSAERLAEGVSELGLRYTRTQVTNLESGRRDSITVGEVLAFAAVLDVPPFLLLVPLGQDEEVEALPGRMTDAWQVYRWMNGEVPTDQLRPAAERDPSEHYFRHSPAAYVIELYRRHDSALYGYLRLRSSNPEAAKARADNLAAARVDIERHGLWLPPIPEDVAEVISGLMVAWSPVGQQ